MANILQRCKLPSLRDLAFSNALTASRDMPWNVSSLKNLLHERPSHLTSLRLYFVPVSDGDMITLLQLLPSLTRLAIKEYRPPETPSENGDKKKRKHPCNLTVAPTFLRQLSLPNDIVSQSDERLFLPHLKVLELCVHAEELDQRALAHAVVSRSRSSGWGSSGRANSGPAVSNRCFKSVTITVSNKDPDGSFDTLWSLECLEGVGTEVWVMIDDCIDEENDDDDDDEDSE